FVRAKEVFSESKVNSEGLDSILKNMDSLLKKYHIEPIDALGEIFNPNFHEAISIINDPDLDDNTITKEIRKGYISHERVIRPTLVEISKKG
ncbi:MAG: nucleotide exchange factor GrpE, partial [Nitrosopumilus sp.]|nr:nucleotide exchange factor GrpE [Nitrosopumilus sp.]